MSMMSCVLEFISLFRGSVAMIEHKQTQWQRKLRWREVIKIQTRTQHKIYVETQNREKKPRPSGRQEKDPICSKLLQPHTQVLSLNNTPNPITPNAHFEISLVFAILLHHQ